MTDYALNDRGSLEIVTENFYDTEIMRVFGGLSFGKLRTWTEDGFPEVVPLLASRVDDLGRVWFKVRIAGRPNGRTGWARESAFGRVRSSS